MLLTLTTTHRPATDLGHLLVKHPDRVQTFDLPAGAAHVFYPEADEARCTAALLVEVDPLRLGGGRKNRAPEGFALGQYVNDRPYAASSLLSSALSKVFRSALRGESRDRPELAATAIPLTVRVPVLRCRGGAELAVRIFAPLGWTVTATPIPLDETYPEWGDSRYVDLTLTGTLRLADALNHLYVLLPVLDDAKHYWVAPDEVDKLLRAGAGWLAGHPERALITRRYLAHRRALAGVAMARLTELRLADEPPADDSIDPAPGEAPVVEDVRRASLAVRRREAVLAALRDSGASRVLDLGCGGGALLTALVADRRFTEVVGVDVSDRSLAMAARRLRLDRLPERQRDRIRLWQSALTYRDDRLRGYDAAVLMEVVEHLDPPRLPALEDAVFGHARPGTVVVTTPNIEYNVRYEGLGPGRFRHADHRFEWTRAEFAAWVDQVAAAHGYTAVVGGVGDDDPEVGAPTQMAVLTRADRNENTSDDRKEATNR
ncbi:MULTISPECIES: 3' terminal RNA ribose 2'-O-methyltransferase Hen1 [Micromonospora]|uniref:3' terminal RNA ribose 2'-O-methyltransferase Hen1 n=1 Tax=Micromonospora TaxID=1873 RepID=UPI0003EEC253|nr:MULTISPECIES: 3' terminal RNA ribose 2'-O-methyltransferase Hen1 [unclassified Micromonospora]EWM66646.1 methyltransferase type 12 [Micromonospora sp. M42]MBP1780174.1 3' terminal RNA ribose 2'-O-methyltransferase Hen1 [Micromonospora sp. HB375]MCK1809296.1 3' terminal RNA ribose 2'-O-methyltransferase Hen1 [Micromonospora sp. R42106]MCK1834180.1 3' terminal RNA ribose 2'-O-methyltransferase Hen1 [Micromonospora sp. R42003]MCK1846121.1 3' terminal RNA ribose 2'-O-methyltransferase Hen1 [Mic